MIKELRKKIGLFLYPQSTRMNDWLEQERQTNEKITKQNISLLEREAKVISDIEDIKKTKERMKLYRNLFNQDIVFLENIDSDIKKDMEINCNMFITKDSTSLMFRHILSWYVNSSLFENGTDINDDFFRGTINGIQMVRFFIEDQSVSYQNRQKQDKK